MLLSAVRKRSHSCQMLANHSRMPVATNEQTWKGKAGFLTQALQEQPHLLNSLEHIKIEQPTF